MRKSNLNFDNRPPRLTLGGLMVGWLLIGVPLSLGVLAASVYIVMLILQSFGVV